MSIDNNNNNNKWNNPYLKFLNKALELRLPASVDNNGVKSNHCCAKVVDKVEEVSSNQHNNSAVALSIISHAECY